MRTRQAVACRAAEVALVGVVINLVVLLIAPLARPDLDHFERSLSYYAVGPWAVVQAIGFVAIGIASIALAVALALVPLASPWMAVCVAMLALSGVASFGLVIFPIDAAGPATLLGDAHQTAGTIGGVAQLVAALAFIVAIRGEGAWARLTVPAIAAFLLALAGAVTSQVAIWWPELGVPMGATMRLLVVPLVFLWGAVALRLRGSCVAESAGRTSCHPDEGGISAPGRGRGRRQRDASQARNDSR